MNTSFETSLLSDDPLDELDDELFGRSHLVQRVIDVLGRIKAQSTSSTIGLVGAWGSGKSSVLKNVAGQIRLPNTSTSAALGEKWLVAEFNPWLFSDSRALHAGFFTMLRDTFPKGKKWNNARGKLITLGRYVAPAAGTVSAFFGGDAETPVTNLVDQFEHSPVAEHAQISKELGKHRQPILVIVDDLDRLTASELLEVFKLVRLVGRLPYVYYVLSYDEHTLIDLLAKTDLVSAGNDRRALDYLEKIVQVRLDMPLLRPYEIDRVVDRTLTSIARNHRITYDESTRQILTRRFDDVMSKKLRTPRSLKRLFGQIDAFLPSVGGEVHFGDFVVVTWLRTMEPGVYDLVQRRRNELLGIETDPLRQADAPRGNAGERRKDWLRLLADAHVAPTDAEDVLWLLSTLFPTLGEVYREGAQPQGGSNASKPQRGRIDNEDYFDRFFAFGVPTHDIADALAQNGLRQIVAGDGDTGESAKAILAAFAKDPHLALRKITQSYQATPSSSPALVRWAEARWRRASDRQVKARIENLSTEFIRALEPADIKSLTRTLASTDEGLLFASRLCEIAGRASYGARAEQASYATAANTMSAELLSRFTERFTELASEHQSPMALSSLTTNIARKWFSIDHTHMGDFLKTISPQRWGWVDLLMWLAPVTTVDDGETYIIGPTHSSNIYYRLLDLDVVAADLEDDLRDAKSFDELVEKEATPDARREYALAAIREAAELSEAAVSV